MTVLRWEGTVLGGAMLFYERKSCQQCPPPSWEMRCSIKAAMNPKRKGPKKPLKAGAKKQNQPTALLENPYHNLACVPRGTRGSNVEWGEHAPLPLAGKASCSCSGAGAGCQLPEPAPPSPTSIVPTAKPQTGRAF